MNFSQNNKIFIKDFDFLKISIKNEENRLKKTNNKYIDDKKIDNKILAKINLLSDMLSVPLNNVELKQSRVHGIGVFAIKHIVETEVITLYPADIIEYTPFEPDAQTGLIKKGVIFGNNTSKKSEEEYKLNHKIFDDYKCSIISKISIFGCPDNKNNPAYLGHFINDAAKPTKDPRSYPIYMNVVISKQNCMFYSVFDTLIAIVATRDIEPGEELFIPYSLDYWIDYNNK